MRTLIGGFGNVLRGDDGFGVEVIHRLESPSERARLGDDVTLVEIGTAGVRLAQELMEGFERLIVVDAAARGAPPGSVSVLEVQDVERITELDLHLAVPSQALGLARTLGVLPPDVALVVCEPLEVDELSLTLSPAVRHGVDIAVRRIHHLLEHRSTAEMT